MKLTAYIPLFFLTAFSLSCCTSQKHPISYRKITLDSLSDVADSQYVVRCADIRKYIDNEIRHRHDSTFVDIRVNQLYKTAKARFFWISYKDGRIDERADTLLARIKDCARHGLRESIFKTSLIERDLNKLKTLELDGEKLSAVMARTELNLTRAYMRYCCGMRYGFINPRKLFNRSEKNNDGTWKLIYDVNIELPNEEFIALAEEKLREHDIAEFMSSLLPTNKLYVQYLKEYATASPEHRTKIAANMERMRWREKKEESDTYILVNIAAFMLRAYKDGDVLEMKICCGQRDHKTPLLNSSIRHFELNPYWIVPRNIVKNEIVPEHAFDIDYFERNNMKIINRESGEEIAVENATPEILLSNKYCIRQEKGEGNSLGRIIFRFPNNFSVYLHDTTNKGAFERKWRGVSHGCVRVEKPFELAKFLLGDNDEKLLDRIRVAMDLPPETEYGKRLQKKEGRHDINYHKFDKTIPVYLSYFTAYPGLDGRMEYYDDVYGYDALITARLK